MISFFERIGVFVFVVMVSKICFVLGFSGLRPCFVGFALCFASLKFVEIGVSVAQGNEIRVFFNEISVSIVAWLIKSLFEVVSLGFETATISHVSAFLTGFHLASFSPEVFELPAEYLIFTKITIELSIEELIAHTVAHTNFSEELFA